MRGIYGQSVMHRTCGSIPVLHKVTTRLNLGSMSPCRQSSLSNLHWRFLLLDTDLDEFNVLLHVKDLLQNLHYANKEFKLSHWDVKVIAFITLTVHVTDLDDTDYERYQFRSSRFIFMAMAPTKKTEIWTQEQLRRLQQASVAEINWLYSTDSKRGISSSK